MSWATRKDNEDPTFTCIPRIITGDKSCIYSYDPETKQQLLQWKSPQWPRAKKVWQVQSSTKNMLIVSSMWRGLYTENLFLLTLRSTLDFYCDILRCLRENVKWKRPQLWHNCNWLFQSWKCMCPHIPKKPQSLWLTTTWLSFPILLTCQT
jgi:hypothetical protein